MKIQYLTMGFLNNQFCGNWIDIFIMHKILNSKVYTRKELKSGQHFQKLIVIVSNTNAYVRQRQLNISCIFFSERKTKTNFRHIVKFWRQLLFDGISWEWFSHLKERERKLLLNFKNPLFFFCFFYLLKHIKSFHLFFKF